MSDDKKLEVKQANKFLYNKIAGDYEKIDGRRSEKLLFWLRRRLEHISREFYVKDKLLDIGCGNGFVLRAAEGIFNKRYGFDISDKILKKASIFADGVVCADADFMPFMDKSIDAVMLFSALHHFYDYKDMIREIHRVLKPGGILYIDHDISKEFVGRFGFLVWLYRNLFRRKNRYLLAGIEEKTYDLSEFHSGGIDADKILTYLMESGFKIYENYCHWYGLNSLTDCIFKNKRYKQKDAPLISIVAEKRR